MHTFWMKGKQILFNVQYINMMSYLNRRLEEPHENSDMKETEVQQSLKITTQHIKTKGLLLLYSLIKNIQHINIPELSA